MLLPKLNVEHFAGLFQTGQRVLTNTISHKLLITLTTREEASLYSLFHSPLICLPRLGLQVCTALHRPSVLSSSTICSPLLSLTSVRGKPILRY